MSLKRSITDFLKLEEGSTGARRLLQTSAVAVAVLAASGQVAQGWYNGGCESWEYHYEYSDCHDDVPHSDSPHSNYYDCYHIHSCDAGP